MNSRGANTRQVTTGRLDPQRGSQPKRLFETGEHGSAGQSVAKDPVVRGPNGASYLRGDGSFVDAPHPKPPSSLGKARAECRSRAATAPPCGNGHSAASIHTPVIVSTVYVDGERVDALKEEDDSCSAWGMAFSNSEMVGRIAALIEERWPSTVGNNKGMTDAARATGVTANYLSMVLNRKRKPSVSTLVKIAQGFVYGPRLPQQIAAISSHPRQIFARTIHTLDTVTAVTMIGSMGRSLTAPRRTRNARHVSLEPRQARCRRGALVAGADETLANNLGIAVAADLAPSLHCGVAGAGGAGGEAIGGGASVAEGDDAVCLRGVVAEERADARSLVGARAGHGRGCFERRVGRDFDRRVVNGWFTIYGIMDGAPVVCFYVRPIEGRSVRGVTMAHRLPLSVGSGRAAGEK